MHACTSASTRASGATSIRTDAYAPMDKHETTIKRRVYGRCLIDYAFNARVKKSYFDSRRNSTFKEAVNLACIPVFIES